jgi:HEAT repeat protein
VVLVTDGMETCHEDPAAVAETLTLRYQVRRVEVVGLGIKEEEKSAVMHIARRGRGKFYDAQTAQQLVPAIKEVVGVALEAKDDQPADLPPRVKALAEALQDADADVRQRAAKSLGKLGAKAKGAVPTLVKLVANERYEEPYGMADFHDKDAAVATLKMLAPEKVIQLLSDATNAKDPIIRWWAANNLREAGPEAKGAVPALVKLVSDERHGHRSSRAPAGMAGFDDKDAALAALKTLAPERVEKALSDATKAKDLDVKRWASTRLGELDEEAPTKPNHETNAEFEQAITIYEKTAPKDSAGLAKVLEDYAAALRKQGRADEAETLERRARFLRKKP